MPSLVPSTVPSDTSYWARLQERLRVLLEPEEYGTWIAPLAVASENETGIVLEAPNERFVHTLEETYRDTIDREAGRLFDEFFSVTVVAQEGVSAGQRSELRGRRQPSTQDDVVPVDD